MGLSKVRSSEKGTEWRDLSLYYYSRIHIFFQSLWLVFLVAFFGSSFNDGKGLGELMVGTLFTHARKGEENVMHLKRERINYSSLNCDTLCEL